MQKLMLIVLLFGATVTWGQESDTENTIDSGKVTEEFRPATADEIKFIDRFWDDYEYNNSDMFVLLKPITDKVWSQEVAEVIAANPNAKYFTETTRYTVGNITQWAYKYYYVYTRSGRFYRMDRQWKVE